MSEKERAAEWAKSAVASAPAEWIDRLCSIIEHTGIPVTPQCWAAIKCFGEAAFRQAIAQEREACALLAEQTAVKHLPMRVSVYHEVDAVAAAIRARAD